MARESKATLLIYMASDNNLDGAGEDDLESLRKGSFYSDMTIVVQRDRWSYAEFSETIRYHIKNGDIFKEERLGETNTGDPDVLKRFIEESAKNYPSQKLIVVIWSHGTGVDDLDIYKEGKRERYFVPTQEIENIAIAFDDSAKDFLDNIELQKALDVDIKIDILGFDACLMSMFEVAYQLRDNADIMVGSQHLEPSSGWDYQRVLEDLEPENSSIEMGESLVKFYSDYYERENDDVTQSAFNLKNIEEVANKLDIFAKLLLENLESKNDLKYTLLGSQLFNKNEYVDFVDFVRNVDERLDIEALREPSRNLLEALESFIIANETVGYSMRDANGVSLYFPSQKRPFKETFEMYEKLDFSKKYPHWIGLIKWYYH